MNAGVPLLDFTNIGMRSRLRAFPGFPLATSTVSYRLSPRGAVRVAMTSGDLLSLSGDAEALAVGVLGPNGVGSPDVLGLSNDRNLADLAFDQAEIDGWAHGMGISLYDIGASEVRIDETVVLKAKRACTVWLVLPAARDDTVFGVQGADVVISHSRSDQELRLPEPLGEVSDEFTIPRGTARAYEIAKGEFVQIIDVEGQQCSDFVAFRSRELESGTEMLIDSTATRSMVRQTCPQPGLFDKFFDQDLNPMLQVVQDTCGRHDTFRAACTARGYEERGFPGHVNCSDNISESVSPYGVACRDAWPAVNFFWNTWVDPHTGHTLTEESYSRPGDYVAMRAMTDLTCVSTACPDDIDPINGWNPTDIHVRIYKPTLPIRRAVAYRVKEDAQMTISRDSAFHPRTSALTDEFAPARDLWIPSSFPSVGSIGEYWACRENVALQDMSSLRKYDVVGPDAEKLLQKLLTRDVSRLAVWRGSYALLCDETGSVVDDGTLFRLAPHLFRWCCGSEKSARRIEALVAEEDLQVRLLDMSDALANVALQGPKSRELLSNLVFTQPHVPSLDQLQWFGVSVARLRDREGVPFMLSRTGYTGELGYELFCSQTDAVEIWDALMEEGQDFGICPMGTAALDMIRIEAGLAASGTEFGSGHDAWESGLGFAVDLRKEDFTGRAALERNARDPRRLLKGLIFEGDDVPLAGTDVFVGECQVGVVTSATRSPRLGRGIAMARLAVEYSATGTALDVGMMDGHMKRLPALVSDIPFIDPKRERARA